MAVVAATVHELQSQCSNNTGGLQRHGAQNLAVLVQAPMPDAATSSQSAAATVAVAQAVAGALAVTLDPRQLVSCCHKV